MKAGNENYEEKITMSKNLIIYYSRKGENSVNGRIVKLAKGNTEICAEYIQKAVGGDLFEVSTNALNRPSRNLSVTPDQS